MILCDAGVLLCLVDRTQSLHQPYRKAVISLQKPLMTTWSCLTEAMYLAHRQGGWSMQKQLWQMLTNDLLMLYEIDQEDHKRLSALTKVSEKSPISASANWG